jgi:hypothetical protein
MVVVGLMQNASQSPARKASGRALRKREAVFQHFTRVDLDCDSRSGEVQVSNGGYDAGGLLFGKALGQGLLQSEVDCCANVTGGSAICVHDFLSKGCDAVKTVSRGRCVCETGFEFALMGAGADLFEDDKTTLQF